jgi:hypothetical protein
MRDYPTLLNLAYDILQEKKSLPEKFVKFEFYIQTLPPEIPSEVNELFIDINRQIDDYKHQYAILVQELGVLSSGNSTKHDTVYSFFMSLLDLFKLAYTTYQEDEVKLQPFHVCLDTFVTFLETKSFPPLTPLEQGLFLELSKSAWNYTKTQHSMTAVAKQVGGRLKNHTRKQKRKA